MKCIHFKLVRLQVDYHRCGAVSLACRCRVAHAVYLNENEFEYTSSNCFERQDVALVCSRQCTLVQHLRSPATRSHHLANLDQAAENDRTLT